MLWERYCLACYRYIELNSIRAATDMDRYEKYRLLVTEGVNRRRYTTRADVFDYIEVFYNQRKRRKLKMSH